MVSILLQLIYGHIAQPEVPGRFPGAGRGEGRVSVVFVGGMVGAYAAPQPLASDAALSLAESMGFLFDDWIATDNPATRDVASQLWGQFVEAAESSAAGHSQPISTGLGAHAAGVSHRNPAIPLTKFRRGLPWRAPESAGADSDSPLARQRGG